MDVDHEWKALGAAIFLVFLSSFLNEASHHAMNFNTCASLRGDCYQE